MLNKTTKIIIKILSQYIENGDFFLTNQLFGDEHGPLNSMNSNPCWPLWNHQNIKRVCNQKGNATEPLSNKTRSTVADMIHTCSDDFFFINKYNIDINFVWISYCCLGTAWQICSDTVITSNHGVTVIFTQAVQKCQKIKLCRRNTLQVARNCMFQFCG